MFDFRMSGLDDADGVSRAVSSNADACVGSVRTGSVFPKRFVCYLSDILLVRLDARRSTIPHEPISLFNR